MASQAIAGYKGLMAISSASSSGAVASVAELRNWTVTYQMTAIDVTSHDSSGDREIIPGIRSWSATAEHLHVMASSQHKNIFDALVNENKLAFEFFPTGTSGDGYYSGTGYVENWELGAPNTDALLTRLSITGSSQLARASSA